MAGSARCRRCRAGSRRSGGTAVSQFVEECRREWKRLRVPDPVANEMAADLAADLAEAEAEGGSAEDVLGSGAFDPRSFAASWATERGVIPQPPPVSRDRIPRRSGVRAAIAAFALIAIIGAVLAIVASPSRPGRLALASPFRPALRVEVTPPLRLVGPPRLRVGRPWVRVVVAPRLRFVPPRLPGPNARVVAVEVNGS